MVPSFQVVNAGPFLSLAVHSCIAENSNSSVIEAASPQVAQDLRPGSRGPICAAPIVRTPRSRRGSNGQGKEADTCLGPSIPVGIVDVVVDVGC